jgi:hypothetical protein
MISFFRHPLATTRGAKAATLARERHCPLKVAGLAFCAEKTVLKNPATQITPKLFDNKFRKSFAVRFSLGDESLDMLGKDLVQDWTCPGFVEPFDKMDSRHWEKLDGISKFK